MNSELEYSQTVTTSGGGADVCHAKIEAPSDQNCTLRLRGQVKNSASTSLYPKFFFIICSSGDITSAGTFSASVTLKRRRFGDSVTGRTTLKTCSGNPTVTTGSSAGQKVGERGVGLWWIRRWNRAYFARECFGAVQRNLLDDRRRKRAVRTWRGLRAG